MQTNNIFPNFSREKFSGYSGRPEQVSYAANNVRVSALTIPGTAEIIAQRNADKEEIKQRQLTSQASITALKREVEEPSQVPADPNTHIPKDLPAGIESVSESTGLNPDLIRKNVEDSYNEAA